MNSLVMTMAKKRAKSAKPVKAMAVGIRASDKWSDWLTRFAVHCELNKVDVIDLALVDFAKKMKFEDPPMR